MSDTTTNSRTWDCPERDCGFTITGDADTVGDVRFAHLTEHLEADKAMETAQAQRTDQAVVTDPVPDDADDDDDDEPGPVDDAGLGAVDDPAAENRWREWTQDQILSSLKAYATAIGHTPSSTDWLRATHERPSLNTIKRGCGSWGAALAAAGLEASKRGRKPGHNSASSRSPIERLKYADGRIDFAKAAAFVQECRSELETLERKAAKTKSLLREALATMRESLEQEEKIESERGES